MKALKNEDIQKIYLDLGLSDDDNIVVRSEINEGYLNNNLNCSFVASYENQKSEKPYYTV